jgi:hypothetical protein
MGGIFLAAQQNAGAESSAPPMKAQLRRWAVRRFHFIYFFCYLLSYFSDFIFFYFRTAHRCA